MILSGYVSQPQTHIQQGLVNEEEPLPLIIVLSLQIKLHILARISGSLLFNKTNFIPVLEIIYRISYMRKFIHLFNSYQEIYQTELDDITFMNLLNCILTIPQVKTIKFYSYQLCDSFLGISNQIATSSTTNNNIIKVDNTSFFIKIHCISMRKQFPSILYKNSICNMISFKSIVVSIFSFIKMKYNTIYYQPKV